jgi:hypothetical protein
MAVLIEDVFPVGLTVELLDAVTDEMGVDGNLPPGGVMNVHFERDGRAHGVDVWESVEAYDQFVQSTLMPAMGKVAAARGLDPSKMGEPEVKVTEVPSPRSLSADLRGGHRSLRQASSGVRGRLRMPRDTVGT